MEAKEVIQAFVRSRVIEVHDDVEGYSPLREFNDDWAEEYTTDLLAELTSKGFTILEPEDPIEAAQMDAAAREVFDQRDRRLAHELHAANICGHRMLRWYACPTDYEKANDIMRIVR